jgi:carboxypeptidase Taq
MGLHEAQARLWENHVGRSAPFWKGVFPQLKAVLGSSVPNLDAMSFYRTANRVKPGLIRATADELSYHLHILLRFELEMAMISGDLKVADLEGAWNERQLDLLGVPVTNPLEGVLQDGHWPAGMFGYFPTYTIGSLYAAQLAEAYARDNPLAEEIEAGNFRPLLSWLRRSIHNFGDRLTAEELVTGATGSGLGAEPYFRHIASKYE